MLKQLFLVPSVIVKFQFPCYVTYFVYCCGNMLAIIIVPCRMLDVIGNPFDLSHVQIPEVQLMTFIHDDPMLQQFYKD